MAYEIEVDRTQLKPLSESSALAGNPQLIQLRIAEKWDGQLPRFRVEILSLISSII